MTTVDGLPEVMRQHEFVSAALAIFLISYLLYQHQLTSQPGVANSEVATQKAACTALTFLVVGIGVLYYATGGSGHARPVYDAAINPIAYSKL